MMDVTNTLRSSMSQLKLLAWIGDGDPDFASITGFLRTQVPSSFLAYKTVLVHTVVTAQMLLVIKQGNILVTCTVIFLFKDKLVFSLHCQGLRRYHNGQR